MPDSIIGTGAKRYSLLMTLLLMILIFAGGIVMQITAMLGAYIWP